MSRSGRVRTGALIAVLSVLGAASPAHAQAVSIPLDRETLSGTIAGRACRDLDANGRCSVEEPGYPGLRLVLESGAQVWTDEKGRYHFSAVSSRTFEARPFVHLRPGRHRVEVDARGLLRGARVVPPAATVEVPLAGMVLQDFAVQEQLEPLPPIASAREAHPPTATRDASGRTLFEISGRASTGDRVLVSGLPVEVAADGTFRARVPLKEGENDVFIRVESPQGTVRLLVQRIHLVTKPGGALIIPGGLQPSAELRVPGTEESPARAGPGRVRVAAPAGTVVVHPSGELTVEASGAVDVPVQLDPGPNVLELQLRPPGQPPRVERVEIVASAQPFSVGLLDLEATFRPGREGFLRSARLIGRGATSFEVPVGSWRVEGQLDLRDDDFPALRDSTAGVLLAPRNVFDLERALDPERVPWGIDDSTELVPNPAQARVRLEASHPEIGRIGLGTWRARFGDAEIGQYHRELFGGYASVGMDPAKSKAGARVQAFGAPSVVDPLTGLTTLPTHSEFLPTGGSLFYLPFSAIARGSELVRVVVRDGITAVPLSERHLVRGVDYEIDYLSGRILLAQPLSLTSGRSTLLFDPPTAGPEPVLVVDYERLVLGESARGTAGGEVEGWFGPVRMSAGAVQEGPEDARYRLFRGAAHASFLGLHLSAEAARSEGVAHAQGATTWSESGGLEFQSPVEPLGSDASGWAWGLRLRGRTPGEGRVDASWRRRTPGYSDSAWDGRGVLTQLSARVEQPVGPVVVGALGDGVSGVDPRTIFGTRLFSARTLGGYVGMRGGRWEGRLELKDQSLIEDAGGPAEIDGGRTAVGLVGRYKVHERVWLQAGHKQVVASRGEGVGALNDTFTSGGVEVELDERTEVGVHGGWGPRLGPLVWAQANAARGKDVYYGSYSVDVDGPDFGERRAVTGARTEIDADTSIFVEDVGA
ncbi:MAG: flagellar motor protein, partial [Myxococcaceae bacterium]